MTLSRARPSDDKTWQQTKSENTRTAILDAALDCFYETGYNNTTTEKVARKAGVSRGAMLHHFPSRKVLVSAAVMHLNRKRLALFEEVEMQINEDARHTRIGEGIEAFWLQLKTPLYTVFHELRVAARTDDDLREVMESSMATIERSWSEVTKRLFPDLHQSEEWVTANLVSSYLLEGMAMRGDTDGLVPDRIVPWLKDRLVEMFADVREVDRESASRKSGD